MFTLTSEQKVKLTLVATDNDGNPAEIEHPVWSTSVPGVVSLAPGDNPNEQYAVAEAGGTAQISCQCDADLGDGELLLVGTLDIEVTNPTNQATMVALSPASAEPK